MPRYRNHVVVAGGAFTQPTPEKVAEESHSPALRQLLAEGGFEGICARAAEKLDFEAAAPGWVRDAGPATAPSGGSAGDSGDAVPRPRRRMDDIAEDGTQDYVTRRELHALLQALGEKLQNDMAQLETRLQHDLAPSGHQLLRRASDTVVESIQSRRSRRRSSIQRISKDDSPEEVSYAEAFERLGGDAELERCADVIALVRAEVANDESLEDELRELFPGDASMRRVGGFTGVAFFVPKRKGGAQTSPKVPAPPKGETPKPAQGGYKNRSLPG